MTKYDNLKLYNLLKEKEKRKARNKHIEFMDYTWMEGRATPFLKGFHTYRTCEEIDKAMDNFEKGISTFLLISMHPRSGKSQMTSRYLPPHFIGRFPGTEVMSVSYGTDLATSFSEEARAIVKTDNYKDLYPKTHISLDSSAKADWKLCYDDAPPSKIRAKGLTAGLNGNGFHLGILDDYVKNKEEADSPGRLDKCWKAFTNDFMTRRAPTCIVIITATQWSTKDINARIKVEMKKNSDFPKFEIISFPAKAKDYKGPGKYPNEFLFMERFSKRHYLQQYAILGKRAAAAQYDCNPRVQGGDIICTENIEWVDPDDYRLASLKVQWWRVWDLAHTAKQKAKEDPDYTAGGLIAYERRDGDPVPHLWIKDMVRCREGSVKRDYIIQKTARKDGNFVRQAVETSLDSKDAFNYLQKSLPDINWHKINLSGKGDKLVRVGPLEPIFEAPRHVHIVRGDWNDDLLEEMETFTGTGKEHDDQIDTLSAGYVIAVERGYKLTAEQRAALRAKNKIR